MSIKIYTYKNPFLINRSSYWDEIRQYPHLCVSETLVQGLTSYYKRESFNNIHTIDRFLNEFYNIWVGNIENEISQYINISDEINNISEENIKKSFKFNQKQVLESIRTIKELKLDIKNINRKNLSKEQECFINMYENLMNNKCFNRIDMIDFKDKESYYDALKEIIKHEIINKINTVNETLILANSITDDELKRVINECISKLESKNKTNQSGKLGLKKSINNKDQKLDKNLLNELKHLRNLYFNEVNYKTDKIIIHGLHRFTPIIMHLINKLQEIGIEIIFLFNYWDEYDQIYKTWKDVYSWTNESFIDISNESEYSYKPLGEALGKLLEGDLKPIKTCNIDKYSIKVFDNLTSFCDEISREYDEAVNNVEDKSKKSSILSKMNTQFYAVKNSEANDLLKVYYPDQFGEKHFLAYPIGQFILGIYNMWDSEQNKLLISDNNIKECLSPGFWRTKDLKVDILEIYNKVKYYFSDITDIEKIIGRLDELEKNIEKINKDRSKDYFYKFSFFNVKIDEVNTLKKVMKDLDRISKEIFFVDNGSDKKISYNKHYKKLLKILIDESHKGNCNEEELNFIKEVELRLDSINNESEEIKGNIEDLKETIHFYLNKSNEQQNSNWIVRNFEQMDGGVFLSKLERNKLKKYQYCLLSDRNMKPKSNELLSWPLTIEMLEDINSKNGNLEIVLNSYKEYKNFLRYSLFYGIIFCDADIELSYIKDQGEDELEKQYFLLKMLGIKEINNQMNDKDFGSENLIIENNLVRNLNNFKKPSRTELELAHVCRYRYLLNKLLEEKEYYESEYQIRYYCIVLLFVKVVENLKLKSTNIDNNLMESELNEELEYLKGLLPFWSERDLKDIGNKVRFDLDIQLKNGISKVDSSYLKRKINFLVGKISEDKKENNENLIRVIFDNKLSDETIIKYLKNYALNEKGEISINPLICEYCNQINVCLNYFEEGDMNG